MFLQKAVQIVFDQLEESIRKLSTDQYTKKTDLLFGASIGQHVRHVIELFGCLQKGYLSGSINYEKRERDIRVETSKELAIQLMNEIVAGLNKVNKELVLEAGFDMNSTSVNVFTTNYFREIAYNLEHTIHHMALIRIGIHSVSDIILPKNYGVASSTVKYLRNSKMIHKFPAIVD